MRASGRRNCFIGLYASTETAGPSGDPRPTWSATAQVECWARKRRMSQRETVVAGSVTPENQWVFELPYLEGITTKHRLKYGTVYYDVTGINNPGEMNSELHIYATEGERYGS